MDIAGATKDAGQEEVEYHHQGTKETHHPQSDSKEAPSPGDQQQKAVNATDRVYCCRSLLLAMHITFHVVVSTDATAAIPYSEPLLLPPQ